MSVRKTRSDKKIRVGPSLSQFDHERLVKLALSCGFNKTELSARLIIIALDSIEVVNGLQDIYNKIPSLRIYPTNKDGKVIYATNYEINS